jgi:hypothetical protein
MDETDTGPTTSPEVVSAEAARQWAEQQRAHARAQFETPTWIGPARTESTQGIPQQAEPEHDDFEAIEPVVPMVPHDPIPATAHWAEKAKPRLFAGVALVAALAGVITSLVLTITTQAPGAIAGLAASAIVAVIFRGALMGSGITTVDLKGSILRIRNGGVLDIVNLADPVHLVELVGTPDQPTWRLRLEAIDGRTIEIGPAQVDAPELDRIVKYYRAVADRDERERARRFNR